jgi:branched-chain amino acid transport system permease protein
VTEYVIAGLALGGVYALISAVLVFVYRSTGILNFALGATAFSIARIYNLLILDHSWSNLAAGLVSLLVIAPLLGAFLYVVVFRFLQERSSLIKVVVTVGLSVALPALVELVMGNPQIAFPIGLSTVPVPVYTVAGVPIDLDKLLTFVCVIGLGLLSIIILKFTSLGLKVRAFVDSRSITALSGTNPQLLAMGLWTFSTMIAGLAGILVAPSVGVSDPNNFSLLLAAALAAALAARLRYATWAAAVGLLIGLVSVLAGRVLPTQSDWTGGLISSIPFIMVVIAMGIYAVMRRLSGEIEVGGPVDRAITVTVGDVPSTRASAALHRRRGWWQTPGAWSALIVLAVVGILPLILTGAWSAEIGLGMAFAIAFLSYTLVAGEGGMVWLCVITFAGIGALLDGQFATILGLPVLFALLISALIVVPVGVLIGLVTIRLGPLYVAIITLIFGLLIENLLFSQNIFASDGAGIYLARPGFASTDLSFTYFVFALFCVFSVIVWSLRRSTVGLAAAAVRASAPGSASIGISAYKMRLVNAGIAGFLAALGGALMAMYAQSAYPANFDTLDGLVWLAVIVSLGIRSNTAALLGGVAFALLPSVFATYVPSQLGSLPTVLFGVGAIMIAKDPDGSIPQFGRGVRGLWARFSSRRASGDEPEAVDVIDAETAASSPQLSPTASGSVPAVRGSVTGSPILEAHGIGVRFGGLTALSNVSLKVAPGEIVGLVGPNGAGKSTLFGVFSGLLRNHDGTVEFGGRDMSLSRPEARAQAGLARTFQQPELFATLTVRQHLVLADRLRHSRGRLVRDALTFRSSDSASPNEDERVDGLLTLLGLGPIAERDVSGLPAGLTRLVEIGRALAMSPKMVLMDEPTAGLDPEESMHVGLALRRIVDETSTAILLVEHDLDLVLRVSDRVYVLDFGVIIASGLPAEVRADAAVKKAYLGIEELAGVES